MTTHHRRRSSTLCVALLILVACLPGRRALAQEVDALPISPRPVGRSIDHRAHRAWVDALADAPSARRERRSLRRYRLCGVGPVPRRRRCLPPQLDDIERWKPVRAYRRRSQAARLRLAAARRDRARTAARSRGARRSVRHRQQEDVLLLSAVCPDPAGPVRNAGRDRSRSAHPAGTASLAQTRAFAALKERSTGTCTARLRSLRASRPMREPVISVGLAARNRPARSSTRP